MEQQLREAGCSPGKVAGIYREFELITAKRMAHRIWEMVKSRVDAERQHAEVDLGKKYGAVIADAAAHYADTVAHQEKYKLPFQPKSLFTTDRALWTAKIREAVSASSALLPESRQQLATDLEPHLLDLEAWVRDRTVRRPAEFFAEDDHE
jgi:hypothetical protein